MFENLTGRLNQVFDQLRRRGKLSAADVDSAMRDVRLALLDADVHYLVVKDLVNRIRERAVGAEVAKALNPGQQVLKIVNEELISTLGEPVGLNLGGAKPVVILLAGLQGSGKTTAAGKLAYLLRGRGERVLLTAADPYRPAAVQQLQTLGSQLDVTVVADPTLKPPDLAARARQVAERGGYTVLILDTAGRSQLDQELMDELRAIIEKVPPTETFLVVD
ncbi:MAG: signal recognition particle protein, partial [Chloroflexi bacterium]|nr:signal recognition particle protein [Chloroflexota bacterium]